MNPRAFIVALLLSGTAVWAWQYEDEFTLDQLGGRPGGGGNWGTGGRQDFKVSCVMCHLPPDAGFTNPISVQLLFNPALGVAADGGRAYARNTTYAVTVNMLGEHLGLTPPGGNHNMMAATFENPAGQPVGRLQSDTGFAKGGPCPAVLTATQFNAYDAGSTTVTYAGCNTVIGRARGVNGGGKTSWRFNWTSPDAGQVLMYWGVTDGDSDEKTIGDDTRQGLEVFE